MDAQATEDVSSHESLRHQSSPSSDSDRCDGCELRALSELGFREKALKCKEEGSNDTDANDHGSYFSWSARSFADWVRSGRVPTRWCVFLCVYFRRSGGLLMHCFRLHV